MLTGPSLIMLLILSDIIKSLWYMIFSIVNLIASHPVPTNSTLCQVSGFFLSVGIEAADTAVLLIAVHSTLYIFWPNRASGDSGLYPYRRIAYAVYVLFPILMASLAFVKGLPAYVNTGQSCYLATNPLWYRMTLSWIPRYFNIILILGMYGCMYIYVRVKMSEYGGLSCFSHSARQVHRDQVPPTPPLATYGLIPEEQDSLNASRKPSGAIIRMASMSEALSREGCKVTRVVNEPIKKSLDKTLERHKGTKKPKWNWPNEFEKKNPSQLRRSPSALVSPGAGAAPPWLNYAGAPEISGPTTLNLSDMPRCTGSPSTKVSSGVRRHSLVFMRPMSIGSSGESRNRFASQQTIYAMLRQGPGRTSHDNNTSSMSNSVYLSHGGIDAIGVAENREKVRRQLNYLFVYPVVYICVWIFPFIRDVSRYNDSIHVGHVDYWLLICAIISFCIQGLADTTVFCTREKPWRHLRSGLWETFGLDFQWTWSWAFGSRKNSGRTREEMLIDAQIARMRRDDELQSQELSRGGPMTLGGRQWWDLEIDGHMSSGEVKIHEQSPEDEEQGSQARSSPCSFTVSPRESA